jgi:hypothetical protein
MLFLLTILTSLRPAPNAFKNSLTELLSKPSVLLTAWFLMLVVTLLPNWSVLSELVEPRAARAVPATFLSKGVLAGLVQKN